MGSLTGSVDLGKYFEFTLTAAAGFTFDLGSLDFGVGRSAAGPRQWQWRSSVDAYAAPLATYSAVNAGLTQSAGVLTNPDANSSWTGNTLALSGSAATFTGLESVTLRFYGYNSEGAAGTGGLQGPLSFSGSLLGAAGTSYAWAGGAGTWENGQNGNFGQAFANSPTATASFADTGGAVTVIGTVEVATMTVDSAGYSFEGGTISLANAALAVNAGSTTVGSVITGTNGLVKNGNGSLTLSGENTFTGLANIAAGRVVIAADSALGNVANDVAISGTLATSTSLTLGAGRDLSGPATLDIAAGTRLAVSGSSGLSALTLVNTGTLDLQHASGRGVGALTFSAPATLTGSGTISASSVTASGLASGTATVAQPLAFTSTAGKTVLVPAGELAFAGDVIGLGTNSYLTKTGTGTLRLGGALATGGIQIGFSGGTAGGTVVLGENESGGTAQLRLNTGTVLTETEGGLEVPVGLSIGGREGFLAVIGGSEPLVFSGTTGFFRNSGTSGELRLDVDNETTLNGPFQATGGTGEASGITIGGAGTLTIAGDASAIGERITLQDSLLLLLENAVGGNVIVGGGNSLGGGGTIGGTLSLLDGATLIFDPNKTLIVNGASVSFENFGVLDLVGFSAAVPNGSYTLIDGLATINTTNLNNLGFDNAVDLGDGRKAYFTEGSLVLQVVPEPSSVVLAGLGGLLAAGYALRRKSAGVVAR